MPKILLYKGKKLVGMINIAKETLEEIGMTPRQILIALTENDLDWEILYEEIENDEEFLEWARDDFVVRCIRGILNGKIIEFMGKTYSTLEDLIRLEDDIVNAGVYVRLVELEDKIIIEYKKAEIS
ncbi:MAG: hypothetical protein ACO2O4_00435 [Minisyncoccia bacterium]